MKVYRSLAVVTAASSLLMGAGAALAAGTIVVTPDNTQGWSTADTRTGGTVSYVSDSTAPLGNGALELMTDATNAAKAQYMEAASTSLSQVSTLSYSTKQVSGPAVADPSYQLVVDLDGNGSPDTTLVYEPYWNGAVVPGVWQNWDVSSGQMWSSRTFTSGSCSVTSGAGGPPFYTLAGIQAACPNAVVLGYGVNVGTYNPSYVVRTDAFNFNGTVYDFEPYQVVSSKDQCKKGGYANVRDANGNSFKNQGQCVSYMEHQ